MATRAATSGYKLFVSNLPWTVGSRQLKDYFSQFGHLSRAVVIFDKSTGMSKGYGFLTFSEERALKAAYKGSHMLEGRTLGTRLGNVPQNMAE